ncbi:putative serine/threonine-protein kinase pats1 [Hypsibius exemplaris]|uniref:RING-type E3 ubiquitin transferase n=1 Tax=Hypsibius exemplaris TaxID=2072580 RepID=A0A1W0WZL8_HYPEX|nr:putative serine/threonine-protein kinase pats1 [Hypsibius exemplaris]
MGNRQSAAFARDEVFEAIIGSKDTRKRRNLRQMTNANTIIATTAGVLPIHLAIISGNYEAVRDLVSNSRCDVNARCQNRPGLTLAACTSSAKIVKELLKRRDLKVNETSGSSNVTALMAAVFEGPEERTTAERVQVMEVLVNDPRCNCQLKDDDGYSALTFAVQTGQVDLVMTLLQDGRAAKYQLRDLLRECRVAIRVNQEEICGIILQNMSLAHEAHLTHLMQNAAAVATTNNGQDAGQILYLLTVAKTVMRRGPTKLVDSGIHMPPSPRSRAPKVGSVVSLLQDRGKVKRLQTDHGGWTDDMEEVMGRCGIVTSVEPDRDIIVNFLFMESEQRKLQFTLNPDAVELKSKDGFSAVDKNGKLIKVGDTVAIDAGDPITRPRQAAQGRAGRSEQSVQLKYGRVMYFDLSGKAWLTVAGSSVSLAPSTIKLVDSVVCGDGQMVQVGDQVQITPTSSGLESLQTSQFGGWTNRTAKFVGKIVTIAAIGCNCFHKTDRPQCIIQVSDDKALLCWINPNAVKLQLKARLVPVSKSPEEPKSRPFDGSPPVDSNGEVLQIGSVVSFIRNESTVRHLQAGRHWADENIMDLVAKQFPFPVVSIRSDGDVGVDTCAFINDDPELDMAVNPKAITLVSRDNFEALDNEGKVIRKGDTVTLLKDEGEFRLRQIGRGRWIDKLRTFLGRPIVVQYFDREGDIVAVLGELGQLESFNPKATVKTDKVVCHGNVEVAVGGVVRIAVSMAEFQALQTAEFGGWSSSLRGLANHPLTVQKISCKWKITTRSPACVIQVHHDYEYFWINPLAVSVSDGKASGTPEFSDLKLIPCGDLSFEEKLGEGAFGAVYRGRWVATVCAVKHIAVKEIIAGPERDRIVQEAITHSRLVHPHIVQFIGLALERLSMYIVLKCITGFNLEEIVFQHKMSLTEAEKHEIALQVADVIRYLHNDARPKVIHQDIKPSNVMVEKATKQALVTDFGISRMANHSPTNDVNNLTQHFSDSIAGTILYMAPELLNTNSNGLHRTPNFQSDIYALGATLTELYSSRRIFGVIKDMPSLLAKKIHGEPEAIQYVTPTKYQDLLHRSMSLEPSQRPTATELVRSLLG